MKQPIQARYHEVRRFREEGLAQYPSRLGDFVGGPPVRVVLPRAGKDAAIRGKRLGPWTFSEYTPVMVAVEKQLLKRSTVRILEIGPGDGWLCRYLLAHFASKISSYVGLERDPNVEGPYRRIEAISDLTEDADLVIASEVFEHIPLESLSTLIPDIRERVARGGVLIATIPNPIAPGGIARDMMHVTALPWYDFYALLRLSFQTVSIERTYYVWSLCRLIGLPFRAMTARFFEMDWCDGIMATAYAEDTI